MFQSVKAEEVIEPNVEAVQINVVAPNEEKVDLNTNISEPINEEVNKSKEPEKVEETPKQELLVSEPEENSEKEIETTKNLIIDEPEIKKEVIKEIVEAEPEKEVIE